MKSPAPPSVQHLLRELAPQVLGLLCRRYRDFAANEDAVQEALLAAAQQWPRDGLPDAPRAWLMRVASRRLTDAVRVEAARRRREAYVVSLVPPEEQLAVGPDVDDAGRGDDTLDLLFMCCHPALPPAAAIALTLRAVGGLTTAEIARAFLVPEATLAQRISRAKQVIRDSGQSFVSPSNEERAVRLGAVTHVLYLLFNEGYTASAGPVLVRTDLAVEALRLTRMLHQALPGDGEVAGLLALMLLTDARRAARTGPAGELIPLDEQDRRAWDAEAIREGTDLIHGVLGRCPVGPYQIHAAIAALHDGAPRAEDTDWPQILILYEVLEQMSGNPLVTLNHAVAVAMVHGPRAGLAALEGLDTHPLLRGSHRLDATRAHLLERAHDIEAAILHYHRAALGTTSAAERDYLLLRAARLRVTRPKDGG